MKCFRVDGEMPDGVQKLDMQKIRSMQKMHRIN
jgi:hypothetical protein